MPFQSVWLMAQCGVLCSLERCETKIKCWPMGESKIVLKREIDVLGAYRQGV